MNAADSVSASAMSASGSGTGAGNSMAAMSKEEQEAAYRQQQQRPPPEEAGNEDELAMGQAALSALDAMDAHLNPRSVATLSQAWEYNDYADNCTRCGVKFNLFERKHHCRYCGKIFCGKCSKQKCLIPPSSIVLVPRGGKSVTSREHQGISFSPDDDPDRMLTYVASQDTATSADNSVASQSEVLLYGKGLEERFQLAREPLRVCRECHLTLQPLQAELQRSNSHAMRFNHIDPTNIKRLFNSPLAFTLGHEVRKAAYTLSNLLPQPKRRLGAMMSTNDNFNYSGTPGIHQQCQQECASFSPQMSQLDGMRIPAKLLERAKGIAVLTVCKGGFGLAGMEFGTGLVVARLSNNTWSAPSAIGTAGLSWGALLGAQISDHVFVCMTEEAVEMLLSSNGSVQLGADIGVAVGPLGRSVEADYGASPNHVAPIYTYSLSKGLYAGLSFDGKVIMTRHNVNERFYGRRIAPEEILQGRIPTPPAAQPLYDALNRCSVYSLSNKHVTPRRSSAAAAQFQQNIHYSTDGAEYGEWQPGNNSIMSAPNPTLTSPYNMSASFEQQSYAAQNQGFGTAASWNPGQSSYSVDTTPFQQQQQQQQQPLLYNQEQGTLQQPPMQYHQQGMQPQPEQSPQRQQEPQPQPTIAQIPPISNQQDQQKQQTRPPAANDQHSYAGMSDITSDPGGY